MTTYGKDKNGKFGIFYGVTQFIITFEKQNYFLTLTQITYEIIIKIK